MLEDLPLVRLQPNKVDQQHDASRQKQTSKRHEGNSSTKLAGHLLPLHWMVWTAMVCSTAVNTHFTAPKCHSAHSKSDLASSLTAQWQIVPLRRAELPAQKTPLLLVLPVLTTSTAPCCSLLLSPSHLPLPPHFSAPPMSQALLSVHSGLNIGLPWPVLLAKPRGVLILAAVSALYPISLPALQLSLPAIAACQPPALRPSLLTQQGFPLLPTNTLTLLGTLSQQDLSSPERSPVFNVCRSEQMRISIIPQKLHAYMWHCLHYASHCPGNGWTLSFKKADFFSSRPALLYSTFCKGTKPSVQG